MAPAGTAVTFRYGTGAKGKGVDKGRRALRQPRGLHVGADGSLLVADFGNHCVVRFRPGDARGKVVCGEEGKQLPTIDVMKDIDRPLAPVDGEGFLMKAPVDVVLGPEGAILVLDTEEARVQSFSGKGGAATQVVPPPTGQLLKSNHSPEALKNPRSAVVAPDGAIVLCDTWGHRVFRFPPGMDVSDKPDVLAGTPNSAGQRPDQLFFPSCIAFGPDGAMYVSDTNNHRVQRFDKDSFGEGAVGVTVAGSASGETGSGPGELNMPTGICIDPADGSLIVADRANARVMRFAAGSKAGDKGEELLGASDVQRPWGLCVGPDGAIYVSDERAATVFKLGGEAPAARPAVEEEEEEPVVEAPKAPAPQPLVEEVSSTEPETKSAAPAVSGSHLDLD